MGSRRKPANPTLFDECDRERLSVAKALLYVTESESVLQVYIVNMVEIGVIKCLKMK